MPKWEDVTNSEDFQKLTPSEQSVKKVQFYHDVVEKSPKFQGMDYIQRDKVFKEMFPDNEYIKTVGVETIKGLWDSWKKLPGIKQTDKFIDYISDKIEGNIDPEGNHLIQFPRFLAGETLRGYKPSQAIPFAIGMKVAGEAVKPVGKYIMEHIPAGVKKVLLKEFTVGKGQPLAYQDAAKQAGLERMAGGEEANQVAKVLSTNPATGKMLTNEEQKYVGRIFRKEVDIGGKLSRVTESPEVSSHIAKNVEVEVAFNPKIKSLQDELGLVNKALQDKETLAKGLVGKEFKTDTGFIEKATGVSKVAKINPSGKPSTKRFDIGLVSEPVNPTLPTETNIPSNLLNEGERIIRGTGQVSKSSTTNKFLNASRQTLLQKRKILSQELQKEIEGVEVGVKSNYHIFDRNFSEQIRNHPKYQQLSSIADEGRAVMDKWSTQLAESGIPKEGLKDTIENNVGSYMARMYTSKLDKTQTGLGVKELRLRLNGLKHRKDLSASVLQQLGEIKEPALPTAIRVKEISSTIANNKLFNQVASNPEWVANSNVTGKMVQMPNISTMGKLKGKWVIPEIGEDINAITKSSEQMFPIYNKLLSAWKFGKVVLNPATHVRNVMSNTILLDLSGTNHLTQARLFPKILADYINQGEIYQAAKKSGAIGGEWVGSEVQKLKDIYTKTSGGNLSKMMEWVKTPFKVLGNVYQGEEQLAKMVKFAHVLEQGGTPEQAAKEAQKWLFNYNEIPNFMKVVKQVSPFATFTYKAVPRIGEAIVNNPMRVYKYYAFFNGFNEASRKLNGMTPEEYARNEKALPPWLFRSIGGMPANLMMPWKDKNGRSNWLNLEYILPVGITTEILQGGLLKGAVSNPLITLFSDLDKNKDFKGKDIVPVGTDKVEATKIVAEYIYRQLAPSLAPHIGEFKGGYSWEKISDAISKKPDYADRVKDLPTALFDTLAGLKITPIDVDESEAFSMINKKQKLRDIRKQALKFFHPSVSEKEREKGIEKLFKNMQRVIKE